MAGNMYVILGLVGLTAGALGGLLGIGGGLILVPALVLFAGFTQHEAVGTSLAVMLPPIGLFAAYAYYKAGHVHVPHALILAGAFMIGSFITARIAVFIPENILQKVFSVALIVIAVRMFFSK